MRRGKAAIFSGCETHPAIVAPAGSNRRSRGGNESAEAFGVEGRDRRLGEGAELLSIGVEKHQAAFSSGTWLTGTPLTYLAPW